MLRILYKYYGGIDWFYDKPVFLLLECLENGLKKEQQIPKLINTIFKQISGEPEFEEPKKMRSAEDIARDYGIEVK